MEISQVMPPGVLPTAGNTPSSSFLATQEVRFDTNQVRGEHSLLLPIPPIIWGHHPMCPPSTLLWIPCSWVLSVTELTQNLKSLLDLTGFFQPQETKRLLLKYQCQNLEGNESISSKKWLCSPCELGLRLKFRLLVCSHLCVSSCCSPCHLWALPLPSSLSLLSPHPTSLLFDFLCLRYSNSPLFMGPVLYVLQSLGNCSTCIYKVGFFCLYKITGHTTNLNDMHEP